MKIFIAATLCFILSLASFNASACRGRIAYVGNPERVNTIWVPGQCDASGAWHEGYYMHFKMPVKKRQLTWIPAQYDKCGNWVKGHWYYDATKVAKICHKKICKKYCHCKHRH